MLSWLVAATSGSGIAFSQVSSDVTSNWRKHSVQQGSHQPWPIQSDFATCSGPSSTRCWYSTKNAACLPFLGLRHLTHLVCILIVPLENLVPIAVVRIEVNEPTSTRSNACASCAGTLTLSRRSYETRPLPMGSATSAGWDAVSQDGQHHHPQAAKLARFVNEGQTLPRKRPPTVRAICITWPTVLALESIDILANQ